jgi:hypothetical protein
MQNNPRKIGDKHVYLVHQALNLFIKKQPINHFFKTVKETVKYITNLYPDIISITSKFGAENTNVAKDLTLYLDEGTKKTINLFLIKKGGRIQTKNLGAKSFFSKYFLSDSVQKMFNQEFEKYYLEFLENIAHFKERRSQSYDKKALKKVIPNHFPKFTNEIEQYRNIFLYKLREACFTLLKDSYNDKNRGFHHAYHTLFMTDDTTIITRYGKYESSVSVEKFSLSSPYFNAIEIYKSGKNSVGIKFGETALTLRFKFESGPVSSIKLAVSYDTFPSEAENEAINKKTIRKMSLLLNDHRYRKVSNQSNAIGKCHEAITYYYFLEYFPNISQVESNECVDIMTKYYNIVKPEVLADIFKATSTIVPAIRERLYEKYLDYEIESIELVPDSYIKDKLDTGDLKLILRVNNVYEVESISLKALARKNNRLTTKNPGIGSILGPTYFDVGDLTPVVKEVKENFLRGELDHRASLEALAGALGTHLKTASQDHLKQGIENLLGRAMIAITFYQDNVSVCKEHSKIASIVNVFVQTPTGIQNTLTWNDDLESINLRVKFSKGHKYGWSTVKLTAEYLVKN